MSAPLIHLDDQADDADGLCGPDGCLIPANHPALSDSDAE